MQTVELAFETYGEPQAIPLIIIHGFCASARNWRSIAKHLADTRRVFLLDMRNHGASPDAEPMNYPSMVGDVLAFMDAQEIAQADLLGHSMGGKVAMWLALQQPQRLARLIVADIAPVTYQHSFDATIGALKSLPLQTLSNRKQAEELLAEAIPDLSYRQFLLQNLQLQDGHYCWRINLDIFARNAPNIVAFPACDGLVYDQTALFLAGEQSEYVREQAVYQTFPQAEIIKLADAGHWLHVQAPQAFCQAVVAFFANNPR